MADTSNVSLSRIEPLTGFNYHIWALKVSAILRSKKLFKDVIEDEMPSAEDKKLAWEEKNDEAFGILIVTLAPEQAGIFIGERSAKKVWDKLHDIYAGNTEDLKIDMGLELKNIKMGNSEPVEHYITRARNIASRSAALGLHISDRELVYHVVRGINSSMEHVAAVLRPQRSISLEEVYQALKEEETRGTNNFDRSFEKAYKVKSKTRFQQSRNYDKKTCYICRKPGHIAKECWHRSDTPKFESRKVNNFKGKTERQKASFARNCEESSFWTSFQKRKKHDIGVAESWNLDSGCTSHMTSKREWLVDSEPCEVEINLAEENRSIAATAKGNVKILTTTSDGFEHDISVDNVLYVPNLRSNLLSVSSCLRRVTRLYLKMIELKYLMKTGNW